MRKLVAAGAMALGIATLPLTAAHASNPWTVTIKASATTVNVGQQVGFKGSVKPRGAAAGRKVVLQERFKPGARWQDQTTDTINSRGKYSLADTPTKNTLHSYRVVMKAAGMHSRGVSKVVKVAVFAWTSLVDVPSVNDANMGEGPTDINGRTFDNSVYSRIRGGTASIEFNLNHRCDRLRSTFGVTDDSTTDGQAEVGVLSDGSSVYDQVFDVGQSEKTAVPLATPLKVKLVATDTSTVVDTFGYGAFGNAQAHCTQ